MTMNYQDLLDAGFSEQEARQVYTKEMASAGFLPSEINEHLNNVSGVRPQSLAGNEQDADIKTLATAMGKAQTQAQTQGKNLNFLDALQLGFEQSVIGMAASGKLPRELSQEEIASLNFFERTAMGISEVVSDTPIYMIGGALGKMAGGAAGTAIGSLAGPEGAPIGGAVGQAAGGTMGAFGFQRAMRSLLIDQYKRGSVKSFDELLYRLNNASKEFFKGAAVGGATAGGGAWGQATGKALAGITVKNTAAKAVLGGAAKAAPTGGEILGLVTGGAAVEGKVPTAQDFVDSGVVILTLKGVHAIPEADFNKLNKVVTKNLYERFVETGEHPADVADKAVNDPVELEKILSEKAQIKTAHEDVEKYPLKGTREGKDDIMATMRDGIKKYIVNRGAAIQDPKTGDIVVQGPELKKATGTNRNFGFSKLIFKHGISVEEAQMLPEIVRNYEPLKGTDGKERFCVPLNDKEDLFVVFRDIKGGKPLITMYKEPKGQEGFYSQKRPLDASDNFRAMSETTNQAAGDANADSQRPTNNIPKKAQEIKRQLLSGEDSSPIALKNGPKYDYQVKLPYKKNKETMPAEDVKAEDAAAKHRILDDLKKAFDVPVRGWKMGRRGRGAKGLFFPKEEMVRVKFANDIATTAHELGHYLEQKMYGKVGSESIVKHYDELSQLASKPRGRATKSSVAGEGFAQFISTYVADPKTAKEKAPKFYEYFEQEIKTKEPEIYEALQHAREQVEKFVEQPAVMEVLGNISINESGVPKRTFGEKWRALKNKVKVNWVDDKAPLLRIVDQLEKKTGEKVDFSQNPYYLARLFPGWVGRAEAFVEHGTFDYNTLKDTGKSLKSILEPVENLDELRAYLASKRAVELYERGAESARVAYSAAIKAGKSKIEALQLAKQVYEKQRIEPGIRLEAARQVVAELEGKYKAVAQELYAYQNALLKYQLDGGLISKETYDKVLATNKNRVPFYRVMDVGQDYALGSRTLASKQVLKRIKGSTRTIIDPIESIVKDTYETINAVERNRVGQSLAKLAKIDGAGEFIFRIDNPVKGVKTFDDGSEHFTFSQTIDKNNQIKVFIDGKAQIYEVDKDVAALINGLNPSEVNGLLRVMSFFTNSLRSGATVYNLSFSSRNFLRDSGFAYLLSGSGYNPAKHAVGGAKAAITKNEAYWQFKKAGGDQSSFFSVDRNSLQMELATLKETGYAKRVWNLVKAKEFAAAWEAGVLEPMRWPGEISELSTRLGEFKKSVEKNGETKEGLEKSAFAAREITIDFAKAGIQGRALNMVSAFFNANLQGFMKTGEVLSKHPIKALTFLGTLGMLEAINNYDWDKGKEDEDVAEVNRAQRNINYVFKVGDTIYRVPKPQQIGFVSTMFSQMTTAALDRMNKNDRDDLLRNAAQAFANEFDMNPMPNAFAVPIELWANKSFFFDRPIVPVSAENLLPEYQYTQNTTELTKFISKKLGSWIGNDNTFSPAKAEHIVRGWTGGVGTTILQATDLALRKTERIPDPEKPAATISDIPFVKGFVIRHPSSNAESVQRFYEEYQERMKKYNSFKSMAKQMNVGETNALAPYAAYGGLNAVYRGMSENSAAIRNIYDNPEMSADEKRQNIDQMYLIRIQLAKEGLKTIKEIDNQMEEMKAAAKNQ